jgi:Lon protease (S16) C-terminal proteolytic domain
LPRRNEPDLDVVPESLRDEIETHLVSTVAEVLSRALSPVAIGDDSSTWPEIYRSVYIPKGNGKQRAAGHNDDQGSGAAEGGRVGAERGARAGLLGR